MSASIGTNERRSSRIRAIIFALIIAEVACAFELTMMYVALPTIIQEFGEDTNTVGWVVTAYLLVSASAAAIGGRLGDMYGRRRVLIISLIIAGFGSLLSMVGGTLLMVIIGRGIQGVSGTVMALAFGLAREHLPKERVPVALSMIGASALIAGSFGAVISGVLIQTLGWHSIFVLAAALAFIAVALLWVVVPKDSGIYVRQPLDVLGAVLLPAAVSCLLLGISAAGRTGFTGSAFLSLTGVAVAVGAIWVWWELRTKHPVINIRMFKNRHIALTAIVTFLLAMGPISGASVPLSLISQYPAAPVTDVGLGLPPAFAGALGAVSALIGFLLSPLGGLVARRIGAKYAFIGGSALLVIAIVLAVTNFGNLPVNIAVSVAISVGVSLFYGSLPNLLFEAAPPTHSSEVTGANTMIRNIGQSVATAVAAFILAAHFDPQTNLTSTEGFSLALWYCVAAGGAGILVALFLQRRPKKWVPVVGVGEDKQLQAERDTDAMRAMPADSTREEDVTSLDKL